MALMVRVHKYCKCVFFEFIAYCFLFCSLVGKSFQKLMSWKKSKIERQEL